MKKSIENLIFFALNRPFTLNQSDIVHKQINRYGDFIVFNTPEGYELTSLKALSAKKLAFCYCPTTVNFMKPDDDTYSRIGKEDAELTKPQNEVDKRNPFPSQVDYRPSVSLRPRASEDRQSGSTDPTQQPPSQNL